MARAASAALLTAALTTVAACGSSGSKSAGSQISGAATSTAAPASSAPASASPSGPAGWVAPTFNLPSDMVVKIDLKDQDPQKQQALRDIGFAMTAYYEGMATGKTGPAFDRYVTGMGAAGLAKVIADYHASGRVTVGTVVYRTPTIQLNGQTAVANYCEDQSASYAKTVATGAVATTAPSPDDYFAWHVSATLNAQGDWQVDTASGIKGAKECQP